MSSINTTRLNRSKIHHVNPVQLESGSKESSPVDPIALSFSMTNPWGKFRKQSLSSLVWCTMNVNFQPTLKLLQTICYSACPNIGSTPHGGLSTCCIQQSWNPFWFRSCAHTRTVTKRERIHPSQHQILQLSSNYWRTVIHIFCVLNLFERKIYSREAKLTSV